MTQNVVESWVDAVRNHLSPAADAKRDLSHRQAALDLGGETKNLRINLALQGGGAHGAFTWGVLDALLEDGRVGFEGLSGSSAGAMNAVLVAQGWLQGQTQEGPGGEREGARRVLADFWNGVGQPIPPGLVARGMGDTFNMLPASRWIAHWAGYFSPAERNPPVSPLFYDCDSEDVLLVLLNPLQHEATPRTAQEIDTRLGEIATNANFMREMQLFAKVAEFTRADALRDDNFAQRRDRMNGNQPGHLS